MFNIEILSHSLSLGRLLNNNVGSFLKTVAITADCYTTNNALELTHETVENTNVLVWLLNKYPTYNEYQISNSKTVSNLVILWDFRRNALLPS